MAYIYLFSAILLTIQSVYAEVAVDPKEWATQQQSAYCVEKADGVAPKPENALADVFADSDEFILTMPFCPEGGSCDPGYLYFGYASTQILRETLPDGSIQDTLTQTATGSTFTWTERAGTIAFLNPQYNDLGNLRPLEHVLRRCP